MTADDGEKKKQLEEARKRYAKLRNKKGKGQPAPTTTDPDNADTDTKEPAESPSAAPAEPDTKTDVKESADPEPGSSDSLDAKVKQLEETNSQLEEERDKLTGQLQDLREKVTVLMETAAEVEDVKAKTATAQEEIAKLTSELESVRRQNTQLQAAATKRRTSSMAMSHPPTDVVTDLRTQLESKTSIIESLELDRATFSTKQSGLEAQLTEKSAQLTAVEEKLKAAVQATETAQTQVTRLTKDLEAEKQKVEDEESSRIFAESNAENLSLQLEAEKQRGDETRARLASLEKKLSEISDSAESTPQPVVDGKAADSKEIQSLRHQVADLSARLARFQGGAGGSSEATVAEGAVPHRHRLGEDDPFDDIDLTLSPHPAPGHGNQTEPLLGRSSLVDVINSGISVFTSQSSHLGGGGGGAGAGHSGGGHANYQEYLRREQEIRQAFEARVANEKAALPSWKGWRLDLVSSRAGMGVCVDL